MLPNIAKIYLFFEKDTIFRVKVLKSSLLRYILCCLLVMVQFLPVKAAVSATALSGSVIDSLTHEGVPYVAVYVEGTNTGTMTDDSGHFRISAKIPGDSLRFSIMGYSSKTVAAVPGLVVELVPTGVTLNEIVVKPKKEKYSKKIIPPLISLTV